MLEETTQVTQTRPDQVVRTTRTINQSDIETEPPHQVYTQKKAIFRAYQVIWYILGFIETILVFRVLLKMLAANPSSGFVSFVYAITDPLALPFRGIFPTPVVEGSVIEWSTLVAMLVYTVVAYGIIQLMQLAKPTNPQEVHRKVDA